MNEKYKQIGNAVPVNLAWAVGRSLIRLFNDIQTIMPEETQDCAKAVKEIIWEQSQLVQIKDAKTQTSMAKRQVYKQLDFFDLFEKYALDSIADNSMAHESVCAEYGNLELADCPIDLNKKVLVSLVKRTTSRCLLTVRRRFTILGKDSRQLWRLINYIILCLT